MDRIRIKGTMLLLAVAMGLIVCCKSGKDGGISTARSAISTMAA